MKLYLVRHGESEGNRQKICQGPDSPLSKTGKKQAHLLADRFKNIDLDIIFTSPYQRTQQTAQAIAQVKKLDINHNKLFREFEFPSELHGLSCQHPRVKEVVEKLDQHQDEPDWHYSDEENFSDLMTRVKEAKNFLEKRLEEEILLVSHSYFLTTFIAHILQPKLTTNIDTLEYFMGHITYLNTGISMMSYEDSKWRLLTLNDYAHLG